MVTAERKFGLEERTAQFGEAIIGFAKKIPVNEVTRSLIGQLVRAGANYVEAEDASTKKEFMHCIGLCGREARGTKHWPRMIAVVGPSLKADARPLWQEAKALNLIFGAIRSRKRDN